MHERPHVIASTLRYKGRVFDIRTDELRYADGGEYPFDLVEHGPSFAIVATPSPDEIVLVRQYRHAVGQSLWEIPAGSAEPHEDPTAGAARELREETGYRAGRIRRIGSTWMTPGFCDELMHFFHAEELIAGEPEPDEDERIEVRRMSLQEAWRLVASAAADAKTVLALYWLLGPRTELPGDFCR